VRRSIRHIGLLLGAGISARAVAFEAAQDSTHTHSAAIHAHHQFIQRTSRDLVLQVADSHSGFNAIVLELGYVRDFESGPTTIGLGAVGSANFLSRGLQPFYGSKVPLGGMIFLRLRPAPMAQMSHSG
jgi:hypothetical protein